jgi:hypothetical protein
VTLILGMSKPEGIYLSVDYRVTHAQTGACLDDTSVKFLTVHYPPDGAGPKALLAYTGVAEGPDGTPVGDWLRETMRGQNQPFNDSMQHLGARLNRDLSRWLHHYQAPLIVNVLAIEGNKRFFGGFSNMQPNLSVTRQFEYQMKMVTKPQLFGNGGAAARVISGGHAIKLSDALEVRPRHPRNHMKLLAAVNRRVARIEKTVSPYCHVSFIPASDYTKHGPLSEVFVEHGESVPFNMPMLVQGIDVSYVMQQFMQDIQSGAHPLSSLSPDEVNKHLKRRQ